MKDAYERFEEYQRRDSVKLKMATDLLAAHCHSGNCCGFYSDGNCPLGHVKFCEESTQQDWEDYFDKRWREKVGRTV